MAIMTGIFRITQDAEVRYTKDGDATIELSMAYNHGTKKNEQGYLPSQFISGVIWGNRAESLAPYLVKGIKVFAAIEDPNIKTFQKNDGSEGYKLTGRIGALEFAGGNQQQDGQAQPAKQQSNQQQRPAARQSPPPQRRAPAPSGNGVMDMDDDIPF